MRAEVHEVGKGIYLVHGQHTNWVILKDGDAVTLVDTGYPGDRPGLLGSLAEVGSSPEAVAAVLITHAHNDHLGSAEYLRDTHGTQIYLHEAEVPHARRDFLQQVSVGAVLKNAWRPGVVPWLVHVLRVGGTEQHPVTAPEAFPVTDGPLDLQPDWAWGRCERGDALRVNGRDEEALADYDRALELDPGYASAYASRGVCLANLNRHEEALTDLDRALALNPEYPWALEQRAAVLRRCLPTRPT
ncbi:MBL fold metallo-hydrolase [Streptomyces sp. NPDC048279]|uniref:MBL fold metallo-hydrolase n=1 Tax=Streptomyces sp. NPDC048279 TaxID=3154714 RepID=UPI0034381391